MSKVKKVVLAYSGGLDTSVILKWLQEVYECEVVTFTADIGQGEEIEPARLRAQEMGIKEIFIEDLREEFVQDYVFPMLKASTIYEGTYLLGTAIARPLIAKRQIEIAKETGADSVSHGATGKGNDQVRFELGYLGLNPDINIIAPWREWDLDSRTKLIEVIIEFKEGTPFSVNGKQLSPADLLEDLNGKAGKHGVGRVDIVENRFVGMKSRGVYETPGGSILHVAHRGIEQLILDGPTMLLRDELMPKYASLVYNGLWFSPEREMLQSLIDESQKNVTGEVKVKLFKGNCSLVGRRSPKSIYNEGIVTFETGNNYDQKDADGFIKLNALRLQQRKRVK